MLLDTDDLGPAEQVLGRTYGAVRISGTARDATRMRISRRIRGPLCVDDAESPEQIILCRVRSGLIEERLPNRAPNSVGAEEILVIGALESPFLGRVSRARCDIVTAPNNALLDPTVEDRRETTPVLLRRAMAFIEERAGSDIGVNDLAGATYVSPRALKFRRRRGCTPMEYLRRVRLHHAHQELLGANRAYTTVTQIATKWGSRTPVDSPSTTGMCVARARTPHCATDDRYSTC